MSATKFNDLEKRLGFNLANRGILTNTILGHRVLECVMYDWMHIYTVQLI